MQEKVASHDGTIIAADLLPAIYGSIDFLAY